MTVMPMPIGRYLQAQDVIRFSIEPAGPGGFWTQTIRAFSIGNPTADVRNTFDLCSEALECARETLKPGVTGGDIAREIKRILNPSGGDVGPLGHGMGLDLTEPPYILLEDNTEIKPGMVIAIHPSLTLKRTDIWMGDTFVVTENGADKLSRIDNELIVI